MALPVRLLDQGTDWASLGLDVRLLQAVTALGWSTPSVVQAQALPIAASGRDCAIRAPTGSGKTGAYALPVLQKLLATAVGTGATGSPWKTGPGALVIVPTRELVEQTEAVFTALGTYAGPIVSVVALAGKNQQAQVVDLASAPGIVIATPGQAAAQLRAGHLNLSQLQAVVIDEADLVLTYGGGADTRALVGALPTGVQAWLLSATLTDEVAELKRLVLHSPAHLSVKDSGAGSLSQFFVRVGPDDSFLLLFALLKLGLVSGKAIFFVNSLDMCYKLKLFLERVTISAAVLNAELPMNSRAHILSEFNAGKFQYLIATDDSMGIMPVATPEPEPEVIGAASESEEEDEEGSEDSDAADSEESEEEEAPAQKPAGRGAARRGQRGGAADTEFGVARGIDFKAVTAVINVDCPPSVESYVHRIGRTARGGAHGAALTFINVDNAEQAELLAGLHASLPPLDDGSVQPAELPFNKGEVEGFRYRVTSVLRSVTPAAIREARLAELRTELLSSDKLATHFADNPQDLQVLQHAAPLLPKAVHRELADVPEYLLPATLRAAAEAAGGGVSAAQAGQKRKRGRAVGAASDPLKSFAVNARDFGALGGVAYYGGGAVGRLGVGGGPRMKKNMLSGRNQWKAKHGKGEFGKKKGRGKVKRGY